MNHIGDPLPDISNIPDHELPTTIAERLRLVWPTKTPFSDRWAITGHAWGTSDPTVLPARWAAEITVDARDGGKSADEIAKCITAFIDSPEIDQLCAEVGALHGVVYDPEIARRAIWAAVADAYENALPQERDEAYRFRHNAFHWSLLQLLFNVSEAEL